MKRLCILLIFAGLSSCATLTNSRITAARIIISHPATLVINGDTLDHQLEKRKIFLERDSVATEITAFNDSLLKTIQLLPVNSFSYLMNAYPGFWPGFWIDRHSKKRYGYPQTVYINLRDTTQNYLRYMPLDEQYLHYKNILKIAPLKFLGLVNPSVALSYERRTGNAFSTQLTVAALLSDWQLKLAGQFSTETRGGRVAIEEKWYYKQSALSNQYVGLELEYLKKRNRQLGIERRNISLNIKYGYQKIIKRFVMDFYFGAGIRYRNVWHTDRQHPEDMMTTPRHPNVHHIRSQPGEYFTFCMPLNLSIGWLF